eukprot:g566.t1
MIYLWVAAVLSIVGTLCTTAAVLLLLISLHRTAKTIRPSDDSLICCGLLTKLSVVTKLCFLFGISVPHLDAGRFLFFPASGRRVQPEQQPGEQQGEEQEPGLSEDEMLQYLFGGGGGGGGGGDDTSSDRTNANGGSNTSSGHPTLHHRRPRDPATPAAGTASGAPSPPSAPSAPSAPSRSRVLIVAFSGGAVRVGGLPRAEFRRTLERAGSSAAACDHLFVLDPTGMSFYTHDLPRFRSVLTRACSCYGHVVFVGNCLGASGALALCNDVDLSARSTVLAFNPILSPAADARPAFKLCALLMPQAMARLPLSINQACASAQCRIRLHCSAWPHELKQARLLTGGGGGGSSSGGGGGGGSGGSGGNGSLGGRRNAGDGGSTDGGPASKEDRSVREIEYGEGYRRRRTLRQQRRRGHGGGGGGGGAADESKGSSASSNASDDDGAEMKQEGKDGKAETNKEVEVEEERVLRLLHSDCRHHGLLAKVLKPNGELAAIIEEAVTFALGGGLAA